MSLILISDARMMSLPYAKLETSKLRLKKVVFKES